MVARVFGVLRRGLPLLCACLLWAGAAARAGEADPSRYAGRPLFGVLDELSARGLRLIYSSDLVRPDMIVAVEPPARRLRKVLEQILAPFGLEPRDGPGRMILIVRSTASMPAEGGPADRPARHPAFREAIEVSSKATGSVADPPESRTALGPEEMRQGPQTGGDPNRIIARLPGVAAGDRSAEFGIRGGQPDETLFLLDGLAIDDPFHLQGLLRFSSIIDSKALDSIEMLSGGFPAEYGGRMSGVIDLASRRPAGPPRSSVTASSVNTSYLSEGLLANGDAGWVFSARAWHPDAIVDLVTSGEEGLDPAYYDVLGKVETSVGEGSVLSGHVLAARDGVDTETAPWDGHVTGRSGSHYAWLNLKTPWTSRLCSTTVLSIGRGARRRQGVLSGTAGREAQVTDRRTFASETLGQDWLFEATDRASLKWGFGVKRIASSYDFLSHAVSVDPLFTGGLPVSTDRSAALRPAGTEYGAYVSEQIRPHPSLTMELGVRADRQTLTSETEISPRLNLAWAPGPRSALRLGWGRFHQPQGPQDLQVEDGVTAVFPAQRAEHLSVHFDRAFGDGVSLGFAAYSKRMSRLRPRYENIFNPLVLFPEIEADRVLVSPAGGRAKGIEMTLSVDRGGAFGWRAGYALARAEDEIDGRAVPRSRDQRHTLNLVVHRRFGSAWDIALAGQYHSGWPTTSVQAESVQNPDGSSTLRALMGPRNAARLPPFHRLDVRVRRRFQIGRGALDAFLEITNLYGRDNVCCVDGFRYLPQPDGTVRVERQESFWLRQAPVFGLTWEFGP